LFGDKVGGMTCFFQSFCGGFSDGEYGFIFRNGVAVEEEFNRRAACKKEGVEIGELIGRLGRERLVENLVVYSSACFTK